MQLVCEFPGIQCHKGEKNCEALHQSLVILNNLSVIGQPKHVGGDFMSHLAREDLKIRQEKLEDVAGEKAIWSTLERCLRFHILLLNLKMFNFLVSKFGPGRQMLK